MRINFLAAVIGIGMLYWAAPAKADDLVVSKFVFMGYVDDPVYAQRQLWPTVRASVFYKDCEKRGGRVKPYPIEIVEQPNVNLLGLPGGVGYRTQWKFDCVVEMVTEFFPIPGPSTQKP